MKLIIKLILPVFLASIPFLGKPQVNTDSNAEHTIKQNAIQKKLPPLENLLDSAELYSPLLKIIDADILIQELIVKSEKKDWLSYFSMNGSAKYGRFDNLIIREDLGMEDVGVSNSEQTRYSLGLSIDIPFESVFDRSNSQIAQNEKIKLMHEREKTIQDLRKLVIVQYSNLVNAHNKLVILTSQMETEKILLYDTKLNYQKGLLKLADYSKQKNAVLDLELSMEESRVQFRTALLILQETIGIKLKLNPEI